MRLIFVLLSSVLLLTSAFKLYAIKTYENAKLLYQKSDFVNNPQSVYSLELANKIKSASSAILSANDSKKLEASYLIDLARSLNDPKEQINAYCQALTALSEAIKNEPHDSKSLINWLDVAETINGSECAGFLTDKQRHEIIETAVKYNPTDTEILYSAGLLSIWADKPDEALPLFNKVLLLSTRLSKGKEQTILNTIDSKDKFQKIVPARFPQIIYWSNLLKEKKFKVYYESADVIEKMQIDAINKSAADAQADKSLIKHHIENLERMLSYAVNSRVRKSAFEMIAETIGTKTALGSYFRQKSELTQLRIVRAVKTYDTLALKGVFSDWDNKKDVVLDTNETSVGFYKASGDIVKIVEIVSSRSGSVINPGELKFYISNDNQVWKEVFLPYKQINNPNINKTYVVADVKNSDFKYFKANFASPVKRAGFSNNAREIINVFG